MSSYLTTTLQTVAVAALSTLFLHKITASSQNPSIQMVRILLSSITIRLTAPALRILSGSTAPATLPQITVEWLNRVLVKERHGAVIQSFSIQEFDVGKTSKSGRLTFDYGTTLSKTNTAAPLTAVIKMTRTDVEGIVLNRVLKLYREGFFYSELAAQSQMDIPDCYYTCTDPISKGNQFVLLLLFVCLFVCCLLLLSFTSITSSNVVHPNSCFFYLLHYSNRICHFIARRSTC